MNDMSSVPLEGIKVVDDFIKSLKDSQYFVPIDNPLKTTVETTPNLRAYTERIQKRYFA